LCFRMATPLVTDFMQIILTDGTQASCNLLQKALDNCYCNPFGDATCCAAQKIFDLNQGQQCHITKSLDEQTTGTLLRLPGNNPVQLEGKTAIPYPDNNPPPFIAPVFAYTGASPTATGQIVTGQANVVAVVSAVPTTSSTPIPPKPSSSSSNGHNVPAVPALPHSPDPHLPSAPPAAANSIPSSSSDSDPPETCGNAPKRRRNGLDYHRHHRRLSHVPGHDHDFFLDN